MPHIIVIAGSNGAGKSTVAPVLLRDKLGVSEFVNADVLAQCLSAFAPETVAVTAGKVMLRRLDELANEKADFAFRQRFRQEVLCREFKRCVLKVTNLNWFLFG